MHNKFGKIADQIVNPEWTLINPDSKKKENDPDPSQNTTNENGENQPNKNNNDNKINNGPSFKKSSNKKKSNKRKQNIRNNRRSKWYKLVTMDYLLGKLPEYRNNENEQNVVLIWRDGDERKIELNEHVDILSMKNLYNNQLIRKKRNYNNTFPLQNKLQTKNVEQEDSKENEKNKLNMEANNNNHNQDIERQNKKLENKQNVKKKKTYENIDKFRGPNSFEKELSLIDNSEDDENSMNSKSIDNTNENMKFLKFKNSNRHKYKYVVNNKKHPINKFQNNQTYGNKLKDPIHAQKKGKKLKKNFIKTERPRLNTVKEKQNSLKDKPTISRFTPEFNIKRNANNSTDIHELNKIDTIINDINSNTDENIDNQNIEIHPLSNLNKIRHNEKSKSKKKGLQQPNQIQNMENINKQKLGKPLGKNNKNKQGSHPKTIKPNSPNTKNILIISYDEPQITTKKNSNIAESINEPDEIDTLLDAQNWNSDEKLQDQTNESYLTSFETKEEVQNYSDVEDIKEHDISNNIKKHLKHKSKRLGEKQSNNNKNLPNKIKHKLIPLLKSNNDNEKVSPQKPIQKDATNLQEIPKSNNILKVTTKENNDKVTKTPEADEIDTLSDAQNWNSDEKLQDQTNESYLTSFETKEEVQNYSDVEDIKEHDISNNIKKHLKHKSKRLGEKQSNNNKNLPNKIKHKLIPLLKSNNDNEKVSPQKPIQKDATNLQEIPKSNNILKVTTKENNDKVTKTPEADEIDTLLDAQNWNSDEKLQDQTNESYLTSFETKEEVQNYSDVEDIKEHDISNNIKKHLKHKSKRLGEKQSNNNKNLPNKIKHKLIPLLKSNNDNEKVSPQKPIQKDATNLQEIPKSNNILKVTTKENNDKVTKTPEADEIDTLLDAQNWNSDEKPQDQTNESYLTSFETKEEVQNYSDVEDIKEHDISNNIKKHLKHKSKRLGEKQSNNNKNLPTKIKHKLIPLLKSNNDNEIVSPQKPIQKDATNLQEIPKSNNILKVTTKENNDKVTKTPEADEIDTLLDARNWNSDEKPQDQTNESYLTSFETKEEVQNYSDVEDIKEHDISNNIKKHLKHKSKRLGEKQSNNNKNLPNKIKHKLIPLLKSNNDNEKVSPQKPIQKDATNLQEIPKSNNILKVTTKENNDKVTKTTEADEIDTLLDAQNWNSDEKLQDQTNESYPSSFEKKEDITNYNDVEDIKEHNISNNIKKLEIANSNGTKSLSDEIPEDLLAFTDDSLPNSKDDKIESLIPKNDNSQNILEKNRSIENTNIINEKPHLKEATISNKYVTPNMGSQNLSMDNSDGDIKILDMLDDYDNLFGMTLDDSDLKKADDKSTNIKDKQDNNISINNIDDNNTIKPDITDSNGTLNLSDEIPEDLMAFINDLSYEKQIEEKPSDKSKSAEPKADKIPKFDKELSTDDKFDKNINIDTDKTIQNATQTNLIESEPGKPISSDDIVNTKSIIKPIPSIPKSDKLISNSSPGDQKKTHIVDELISSPIDHSLISHIDQVGLQLPSVDSDDITVDAMEETDDILPNSKDEKIKSLIPKDDNRQNILEKNRSIENIDIINEKPHIKEATISNKYVTPNMDSQNLSMDNSDGDFKILDMLDDYDNLFGMTLDDSDLKKADDKSTNIKYNQDNNITEKYISINNKDDNKTIKPEIPNSIGTQSLSDEIPEDLLAFTDDSLPNSKDDKIESLIPNNDNSQNILEKNRSIENTNIINEKPHLKEATISNKYVTPNMGSQNLSMDNSDGDIKILDMLDDYDNLFGMTLDDSDLKKADDKSTNIKDKQDNNISINNIDDNNTIKPDITDSNGTLNLSDEIPEDLMAFINDLSYEKQIEEKPSDKSISAEPKADKIPKFDKELSTDDKFDKNINIDTDKTIQNATQTNLIESEPGKPISSDDIVNTKSIIKPIPSIPKSDKLISNSSPGDQKKTHIVDELISSPIDHSLISHIDQVGLQLPSVDSDDITVDAMEETDDILPNSKDEKIKSLIPKDDNRQNILEKNRSIENIDIINEKPHIKEATISNKYVTPNMDSQNLSMDNSDGDFKILDMLDDYDNLFGMTLDDSDLKKADDKSTNIKYNQDNNITEKYISINNKDDNKTIKPEIPNSIGTQSLSDEIPEDLLAFTDDSLPNSKDDKIESLIPNNDNSQNILEKNRSIENTNIINEKPHLKEATISNKYVTPNMGSQNLSMDNSDGDIKILDMLDDYDNLFGMTLDDSDLKKADDKSTNIKDKQDNNISINNIDDNNTIKPDITDSNGTLNLSDEIPEDLMAFINDLSYEKQIEEKPSDKSISAEPKADKIPKFDKELSTDDKFDKNINIDTDKTIQNATQTNLIESEPGKPISSDDIVNTKSIIKPIPSIPKSDKLISNSSPGDQKKTHIVDELISSPIDHSLISHIDQVGLQLPSVDSDDITVDAMEETDDILPNSKDEKIKSLIPKDDNRQNILEKNRSIENIDIINEKPHIKEATISNKYVTPNMDSQNLSMDNSDGDFKILDMLDDYDNLFGMTLDDSDLKKADDKSTNIKYNQDNNITEKYISINNKDDNKTIKPEIPNSIGTQSLSDEIPEDLLAFTDDSLPNSKDDKIESLIPNNDNSQNILEKNRSIENTNIINEKPHLKEATISNKYVTPNMGSQNLSMDNSDGDIKILDMLDDYDNLFGMTLDDSDLKKADDKSTNIKDKQDNNISINNIDDNNTIKPDITDSNGTLNLSDEIPEDLMAFINDLSYEKQIEEKPSDKSISAEPKADKIPKFDKELSTDDKFDKNINIDTDKTIQNATQTNLIESEPGKPISSDDIVNTKSIIKPIPSIPKSDKLISNSSPGDQKKTHIVDELISSPIDHSLISHIDQVGLQLPSVDSDDITVDAMEETDDILPNSKDEKIKSLIPKDDNRQNILEKNRSIENIDIINEKPHIKEATISNKYVTPNMDSQNLSMDNSDGDFKILDMLDDYDNLFGMTLDDSDLKKADDKSTNIKYNQDNNITEKYISINNKDDNKTIKPEIPNSIGTQSLSDEIPEDLLAFTDDSLPNSKDDKIESLIPNNDNSQNILEKNRSIENTNIINEKPHLKEATISNKYVTPNMGSQNLSMDNSDGDIKILDMLDDYDNLFGMTLDDSDLKKADDKSTNIKDKQDNNISINNIDDNNTIKPDITDSNGTLNLSDEIPEDLMAFINDLSYEKQIEEKPSDKSISAEPKADKIPKFDKELSTDDKFDKNINIDTDKTIQNATQTNLIESEPGKPISSDDIVNTKSIIKPIPSIPKSDKLISNSSPGDQKKTHIVDELISSPIDHSLISHIDQVGLQLPSVDSDDITVDAMEETDDILPNSKDEKIKSLIPKDDNRQNILEKNRSIENIDIINEKPHIKEATISNKYVTPNMDSQNLSMDNSDGDFKILDMLDDYDNLFGMTLDDSDLKKADDKSTNIKYNQDNNITEKYISINNKDDNKTIKPEIPNSIGTQSLSDEIPEDLLAFTDDSLPNSKDDKIESLIPNNDNSQNILEKNRSIENTNIINEKPHLKEATISNKYVTPNMGSQNLSMDNSDGDIKILDMLDDYDNLFGMTLDDSDLKKADDKSTNIKDKQDNNISINNIDDNNTIKPDITDSNGTLNLSDEIPEDLMAFINDLSYEKQIEEKPSDKSISAEPKADKIPKFDKELSTDDKFDKNINIDTDKTIQNATQTNLIESEPGKPIMSDDIVKTKSIKKPIPSIPKSDKLISNSLPGDQKKTHIVDELISSPIDHSLISHIDQVGLQLPSVDSDGITVDAMEKTDDSLPNSKDEKIKSLIPKDDSRQNILEKIRSIENIDMIIEKPYMKEETISNKYVTPNMDSQNLSMDNSDGDFKILDMLDDYDNLDGMTLDDSDLKKTNDKSPNIKYNQDNNITENYILINNIDDNKTIKPEIPNSIGTQSLSDEIPEDLLAFTDDSLPNSKDDKTVSLIPKDDNSLNILEKNRSIENTNIINEKPHIKEATISNKYVTPNMDSQNLSMDNSDGDIKILAMLDDYDNLFGMTLDDSDLKKADDKSTNIKDKQDNNISINNIDDNNTIKPDITDSNGTLNLSDEIPEDLMAFINDLSYEKQDAEKPSDKSISAEPKAEKISKFDKELSTDDKFNKNIKIDTDKTIQNETQTNLIESEPGKPISSDDIVNTKSIKKPIPSIPKSDKLISNSSPGAQKKTHIVDELISSPIDHSLISHIDQVGLQLPSVDSDDITVDAMEETDDILPNSKDEKIKSLIPKDDNRQNILEKNRSIENIDMIIEKPYMKEETISNKYVTPNMDSQNLSMDNSDGDFKILDMLDDYDNLFGMTLDDSDLKKADDKSTNIKDKQDNNISINNIDDNNTIKPDITDSNGTLNLSDEIPEDLMAFINDLSYEKQNEEKPSDKSISAEPKADKIPKFDKELSTDDKFDKNINIDTDKTIQNATQTNLIESEPGKPISSDDIVNTKSIIKPIPSIPKSDKLISNSSPGDQKKTHIVDELISSPIDHSLISHIDQVGLQLPSVDSDDITVDVMVETDDSLPNSKDDKIESLIPKDDNRQNILEKNRSIENIDMIIEKPYMKEETISNKYVTPNMDSQNLSMDYSDGDFKILDMLDDYDNLDGMTLDDSDLKKTNDKSPNIKYNQDNNITENYILINNIDDNKTIKPEIPNSIGTQSLSDEIPEDLLAFTDDSLPNSKDDKIESLIPKDDNSQNILEKNRSIENTNIINEKPHIKEATISNKYVTPNMDSQNLSMDNSDGDIKILDKLDDYDNLDGMTIDDSDLKINDDKSTNIKDEQDNNISINNIDDNNTIKPNITDSNGTLNLSDEIPEDLMAFINDLSYEKQDEEKPSDNLISAEPKADKISKSDKELSTDDTFDRNINIDTDKIIQNETQTNPFESEPGKPISSDDIVKTKSIKKPIPSIPKSDKLISNSSPGDQKKTHIVDELISSPIDHSLISHIDQVGLQLPSVDSDDITVDVMEETDDSLPNSKDDKIESLIPKDDNRQNILEKNRSIENIDMIIEKPYMKEETISNKYVTPNMDSQNLSMDYSDGDFKILDMLDDYDNLDGMTLDDSDLKKTNDKSPNIKYNQDNNITENYILINNIDDNKTIKPEIPNSIGTQSLSDEIPEDLLAFTDDSLPNSKDDKIESLIPKDDNSQNILEKNRSIENTNIINEKPHIKEATISNKYVTPNMDSQNLSMDNSDGDIKILDKLDDYDNLDGMTIDDSDLKKNDDKSTNIKDEQDNNISINNIDDNNTIKPNITDSNGTLNLSDEIPEDLMAFINDLSYEKQDEEKPSDNLISAEPKADKISKSDKELSTDDTFDRNINIDTDKIIQNETQTNPFESEPGKPISSDDIVKTKSIKKPIPSIPKSDKLISNSSPGDQKKTHIVDELISSPIDHSLISHIDQVGLQLPSVDSDDITVDVMEETDDSLPNSKDDKIESLIPKDDNRQNILEKNRSIENIDMIIEKPYMKEETISNKYVTPNMDSQNLSMDYSDGDFKILDMLDDYDNLDGMTLDDSDLKKTNDKSPNIKYNQDNNITENYILINNIDDNKTIKPEIPNSIGTQSLSDEIPEDLLAFTDDSLPNSKDDKIESLIPKDDNSQNILEKNRSIENTNIINEKPHIKEATISNKYVTPNMDSQNLSMDNSDGDIKILDKLDDYDNLDGMTIDDSDLKKNDDKSTNIKDEQDNNISINNIDDNNTIKPNITDSNGTLNLSDEIPEDLMAFINDLSYEKQDEEKPSDNLISAEPKADKISKSDNELSTDDTFDRNINIDTDKIIQNETQTNPFESEPGKPISSDDIVKTKSIKKPIPSIPKSDKLFSNSSPGDQKKTLLVDELISSPIDHSLISHIDQVGLQLPSVDSDNITVDAMEETDDILPNSKDDKIESLIPKDDNSQNILEKNRSIENTNIINEKPHIKEATISNKYVTPNMYSQNLSMDNSDGDIKILDMLDDYDNLDGMTIDDSDLKKTNDKSTNIKDKQDNNISINNIDDNKKIKPEIADSIGALNLSDEIPDYHMAFNNNLLYEKQHEEKPFDKLISAELKADKISKSEKELSTNDTVDKNCNMNSDGIPLKFTLVKGIKQQNKEVLKTTPCTEKHSKTESLNEFVQTKINNDTFLLANDNPKINSYKGLDKKYYDSNHIDKLTKIINENSHNDHYPSSAVTSEDNSPIISDYNLLNENDNPYGYKLPKFITKYIEDGNSNNLWETVRPKKNYNFSICKNSDNYNNDINQSIDYIKDNIFPNHVNNKKKYISETETVNNIFDDKGNYTDITDIHNKMYDDFFKKISEQLFGKIDKMYEKISNMGNLSNNSTYITQNFNTRPDDTVTKKNIPMNDLPISKPINNMDEPDSKINKSVETHETIINYKINDENVIKKSLKPKKDKHKKHKRRNKKHKNYLKHNRHKKKKSHKKNDKNYNDDDDDDDDDEEDDDNDNFDGSHNKYKIHKKNNQKDDDDKHKNKKSRKKNEVIDNDIDDNDDNGRIKRKSHKKNYIDDDDDIEISRSKKTDKKKKKKIKKSISPHDSTEVNNNSSLQLNSEDDDSVKGLKIKRKSKKPTKTNSTKKKKSSPKKKSKHSKSMKYKSKETPVDASDEDLSSNKNNYNFEEIYVKSGRNNNQNNAPKEKTHKHKKRKHKKPKKHLKISKTNKYKEIPVDNEDKISDENSVNLEETYNINITNDGNALKQKRLEHERLKKMKNIDINIVKDTDNQVLDRNTNTVRLVF
ncbi:hypothetical protein QTP88_009118 [Uroleucon formosanum]